MTTYGIDYTSKLCGLIRYYYYTVITYVDGIAVLSTDFSYENQAIDHIEALIANA